MFVRFDMIHERARRTDRQTDRQTEEQTDTARQHLHRTRHNALQTILIILLLIVVTIALNSCSSSSINFDNILNTLLSVFQPFNGTLKPQSNGPLYGNTVIGTLTVDGWAITFGTVGWGPAQSSPQCTKCNSPPVNGQCTITLLFDVTLYIPVIRYDRIMCI